MGTHTSTGEWQSFEVRMRHRRAERLLLRAEAAAEAGFIDEARTALDEVRALVPRLPGLAETEARIDAAASRPIESIAPSAARPRRAVAAVVVVTLLGASAAAGTWLARPQRPPTPPSPQGQDITLPAVPAPTRGQISIFQPSSEDRDLTPKPPAVPGGQKRAVPAIPLVVSATPGPSRDMFPARGQISIFQPTSEDRDLTPGAVSLGGAPTAVAGLPAPEPEAALVTNDDVLVRAVLDRYAAAYSRLDVNAASAAWPTVNRAALSRAFEGLESQHVSFAACDVTVDGASARAACSGTATWRPKVGGGQHADARTWTFDLSRVPAGWRIVSARAQNR